MATLEGLDIEKPTWWASAIAAVALLATASSVLVSGQKALNRIFRVATIKPQGLGIWRMVRDKIVSLAMLVTVALILSVSLMLDATAALIGELAAHKIGMPLSWLTVVDFALIDVAGTTLLFAMLFRYLPDKQMSWSDTWFGALLTAILLAAGCDRQAAKPGAARGRVVRTKAPMREHPSTTAASIISSGIDCRPASRTYVVKGRETKMATNMSQ